DLLVALLLKQPSLCILVFVKSKYGADSLDDFLYLQNFLTISIHSDRTQQEHKYTLISFNYGLDIKNIIYVINNFCDNIDEYVYRIVRTAHVGDQELATTFYNRM
ncbi:6404_t:CDS:2, partial [Racocetra persica]